MAALPSLGETLAKHLNALLVCAAMRGDERDASQRERDALPGSPFALQGVAADDTVCSAISGHEGGCPGGLARGIFDMWGIHSLCIE